MPDDRLASEEVRLLILECLRDEKRRFLDMNGPSRRWLDHWNIRQKTLFNELTKDLESYRIFLKEKKKPQDSQKYHYVMRWDECEDGLLIHITLSPKGEPPRVMIALHKHDTGYAPLSLIPIESVDHEN
ncbi:MAG: hypothetical protein ACSHX7_04650 [Luteolibacter sp.]